MEDIIMLMSIDKYNANNHRSCFAMTEPRVASSDATNIECSIWKEGDEYVINGKKWWISGSGDPRCKICILMGKTSTDPSDKYRQQSMILVPMDAAGVKVGRALPVFGYDDAPHGHCEMTFDKVRVPLKNILQGEGRGFAMAQARLGPGRIHHCMRVIGLAERCLEETIKRAATRVAFGKKLLEHDTIKSEIAMSRMDLDQARLLVLDAAAAIVSQHKESADLRSASVQQQLRKNTAQQAVAMIKVVAPNAALRVIDRAIQVHGGAGVSDDFILAYAWATARTLRIADGPDEVHIRTVAQLEISKQLSKLKSKL